MSNTCITKYALLGKEGDILEAHKIVKEKSLVNELVTVLTGRECSDDGYVDDETVCVSEDSTRLDFETVTPYGKSMDLIPAIRERFPSLDVYFLEEEMLEGIFYTNDKDGSVFRVEYLAFFETPEDSYREYFPTKEDMIDRFNEVFGTDCTALGWCKIAMEELKRNDPKRKADYGFSYKKVEYSEE